MPANTSSKTFEDTNANLAEIKDIDEALDLVEPGRPLEITTRQLLGLNGNDKRGRRVNASINKKLHIRGLVPKPSIETADYYGRILIHDPRDTISRQQERFSVPLSSLAPEHQRLISATRERPVSAVRTLMLRFDISQIPVLNGKQTQVFGIITWKSIANFQGQLSGARAEDVMTSCTPVADSSDNLLDHVDRIISDEYLLYKDPDNQVRGIITASDLALAYDRESSLFLRLGEIESRLRTALDRSPIPALKRFISNNRKTPDPFRGAIDMQFGEYVAALQDSDVWRKSGINLDKESVTNLLDRVRAVRNSTMHFTSSSDEDEVDEDSAELITQVLRLLRSQSQ